MNEMSYRKLLVPLTGRANECAALEGTMRVAKKFNAHVVGLLAQPDAFDEVAHAGIEAGVMISGFVDSANNATSEIIRKTRAQFVEAATSEGVALASVQGRSLGPTAEFAHVTGNAAQIFEEESRLSDMVAVCSGREADRSKTRDLLDSVLVGGSIPVLYFPRGCSGEIGSRIAIGYDGSTAAAHSVRAALPFLAQADSVQLMSLHGTRAGTHVALQKVQNYLALREISAQTDNTEHRASDLISAAKAKGCNLLVVGGYESKTMREWFLGGVADEFLDSNSSMAVLMAH